MFRLAHPYYLYFLVIVPVMTGLFLWIRYRVKKQWHEFGDEALIRELMPDYSPVRPVIKFILLVAAFLLIIIGLARPQFGAKLVKMKRKGIELIIALDVSNSMNAEDIQPSRLERAKQAIARLVDRLDNDRIGLIVFAGEAYTQLPITSDYVSAKMFLNTINTSMIPRQGTAIGKAIERASFSFTPNSPLKKVIVVITDGENHEDDAIAAAHMAAEKGIIVHAIGIGSPEGVPVPVHPGSNEFMKDREGNVVVTKLNEELLAQIAQAGKGIYVRANNTQFGLNTIMDEIERLEKKEYESKIYTDYNEQFRYFFIPALFLLIIELLIAEKKNKQLSKIKLFEVDERNKNV